MDFGNPQILSFSMFSINERRALQYISEDGCVFICGDAAHVHSPAGMVYHGYAKSDLLKSYETERILVADGVVELSKNFVKRFSSD
ncbi:hypothetical protein BDF19DRAFT_425205 [Syncephalis fuscata]|nr:hypothetical protein BDF19DRAFT_425205 [Syncephalis fuscata]